MDQLRKESFDDWFRGFRASINQYGFYTDFEKVYNNADKYKIEINILNSLVGSHDIKREFLNLVREYPRCLEAIPLLLAVRNKEIYCQENGKGALYDFSEINTKTDYVYFMEKTGLFDLLSQHIRSNLWD